MGPRITVVTVVFNGAETIEGTLQSIASQSYSNVERIIIDGGSTDGTMDIIEKYHDRIDRVVTEPDKGIWDAMNKGIGFATGDVIGFLNADDIYADKNVLARIAEVFEDESVDACFGDLVYVDRNDLNRVVRYWKSRPFQPGLFKKGWMPAHPTFYVRKRIYDKHGAFDLRYPRQSDFELTMRFMELHNIKTRYIPEILVRMRMGGVSNRREMDIIRGNMEAYRACKNHGLDVSPFFIFQKISSRIPQFFKKRHPSFGESE